MQNKSTNKSSANAQSNGWTFQYVAALVIYMEYLNIAKCFCVEGTEDIVVFLKDDTKICAQAKSSLKQDEIVKDNHLDKILDSIRTLSANDGYKILISTFNYHQPMGKDNAFSSTSFIDKKSYNTITTNMQSYLKSKTEKENYSIDFDKLKFWFIRFEGDEPEKELENYINLKLSKIPNSHFSITSLMQQWLNMIELNARDTLNTIETDSMCGVLFGKILDSTPFSSITNLLKENIDPSLEDDFERFFKVYFNENSQSFVTYNKINGDFDDYLNKNKVDKDKMYKSFVDYYCKDDKIPSSILSFFGNDRQISLYAYKLFVAYICYRRKVIKAIREIFEYEDN